MNYSAPNHNMPSVQGSNNNTSLPVVLKLIQGAKGSFGNTLEPLEGFGGGLVGGTLGLLFLL